MSDQQIVGDRSQDDAGDNRNVQIRVSIPRDPGPGSSDSAMLRWECSATSSKYSHHSAPVMRNPITSATATLVERPWLLAVAPATTTDSPSAIRMNDWNRSGEMTTLDRPVRCRGPAEPRRSVADERGEQIDPERRSPAIHVELNVRPVGERFLDRFVDRC